MSRKPSFESEMAMSVRLNASEKFYPTNNIYKKSYKDFDKFSSQVQDRNASQQTHYTSINYQTSNDFLGIRKLPDSISSIRETFSYNPVTTSRRNQYETTDRQIQQKLQKVNDGLRQTFDVRSAKRKDDNYMQRSISTYLSPHYHHEKMNIKSETMLENSYYPKRYSIREDNRNQVKSYTHLSNDYNKDKPFSVQQQIRRFRQQINRPLANKRVDNTLNSHHNIKSSTNLHQMPKKQQNFAKKNYIEYYTPKVQKTQQNQKFTFQSTNVLSPQYVRPKKETSFQVPCHSPRKITDIKSIKENIQNRSAGKRKTNVQTLSIDNFIVGKSLGQGRFGTAHMARDKATGALFALKKVKKEVIKQNKLIDQFILQVKLQSFFVHPFILKIYGIFDDKEYIYIILQFMEQGTLFNYLKKFKRLEEQDTAQKIRYLAESIKYLQDRGIAHRDIKPQNIIMSNDVCKLADFGWATFCDEQRRKTYCGTCDYVAPEILQGHEYDETVDLWCIGVLAYELRTGKAPFYHMSTKQTKKKILNVTLTYPEDFSENIKSFISGLILKDPQQRMSIQQVLVHPFIKKIKLIQ